MSGLNDLPQLSVEAICRTAERAGFDPVAFAEACQDGTWLDFAIACAHKNCDQVPDGGLPPRARAWMDKLAAIERAEPKP